nr:MAG TPA: hypothetical protein [Caudoviricetes sp.]
MCINTYNRLLVQSRSRYWLDLTGYLVQLLYRKEKSC